MASSSFLFRNQQLSGDQSPDSRISGASASYGRQRDDESGSSSGVVVNRSPCWWPTRWAAASSSSDGAVNARGCSSAPRVRKVARLRPSRSTSASVMAAMKVANRGITGLLATLREHSACFIWGGSLNKQAGPNMRGSCTRIPRDLAARALWGRAETRSSPTGSARPPSLSGLVPRNRAALCRPGRDSSGGPPPPPADPDAATAFSRCPEGPAFFISPLWTYITRSELSRDAATLDRTVC